MLTFCIVTLATTHYLQIYQMFNEPPTAVFERQRNDNLGKWTIEEISPNGAYHICSYKLPKYCLGLFEGRTVINLEPVTMQGSDIASPTYWVYNSTKGTLTPLYYKEYFLVTMDMDRGYKPLQLFWVNPSKADQPDFEYSRFKFEIC